ncbi:STAS-like domain-containing protein [Ulvibacter litoralis]|uniref:CAMSAP CH domain-containing protein n=1 Tax=Ulvibacter litoralis TaxID=227084 RepID=A0A1G7IHU8_9FLAO|nr:DUF4325 domain-containing protein [Ulvibacter litoralis]GHC60876.1 hypothetical protein GCM10008083_27410 [Ulvibacter litoralis]SDF12272.1 CAMSAP CH domain-containing protein [Ulvibacter litoralis]
MNISVLDIIKSDLATNLTDGTALFEVIKAYSPSEIVISFLGIRRISSLFLNESIGQYALLNSLNIQELKFEYPEDKEMFAYKVKDVIENALLGDEYDHFVDNALHSM